MTTETPTEEVYGPRHQGSESVCLMQEILGASTAGSVSS